MRKSWVYTCLSNPTTSRCNLGIDWRMLTGKLRLDLYRALMILASVHEKCMHFEQATQTKAGFTPNLALQRFPFISSELPLLLMQRFSPQLASKKDADFCGDRSWDWLNFPAATVCIVLRLPVTSPSTVGPVMLIMWRPPLPQSPAPSHTTAAHLNSPDCQL